MFQKLADLQLKLKQIFLFKNFLPMYIEHLVFCIKRAGWKMTKIHGHLTFEQIRFKQRFILMNKKSRQESNNSVEKGFYKLINNSNFGYYCRNNLGNFKFVPIFRKYREVTFISRHHNFLDSKVWQFATGDLLERDIEKKLNDKLSKLDNPPGIKTLWRRRSDISLYVPATSQVCLK